MGNLISLLEIAFNDSTNYLSWALYSLLAAYITLALSTQKRFAGKHSGKIAMVVYAIFMAICVPNLCFVVMVFKDGLGNVAGFIAGFVAIVMIILNSVPIAMSMKESKDSQAQQN